MTERAVVIGAGFGGLALIGWTVWKAKENRVFVFGVFPATRVAAFRSIGSQSFSFLSLKFFSPHNHRNTSRR